MEKYSENMAIRVHSDRVWRTYTGGKLIDDLHEKPVEEQKDDHFPEEWITSLVAARNASRNHIVGEGLSLLDNGASLKDLIMSAPEKYLGEQHVSRHGAQMGVLIKLLDSAERLTIQVHPDREKARQLFDSAYGKTEAWYILGGRTIDDKPPCIYLGFKEGITMDAWKLHFEEQNIEAMLDCLHCFPVKPQDIILIEGGVPHAIGAGCFLVEIQEPTDYTIRVEKSTPTGFRVDDSMCHQGLGFDKMLECFHYHGYSKKDTMDRWFLKSERIEEQTGGSITSIIRYEDTELFKMNFVEIKAKLRLNIDPIFSCMYILSGNGCMEIDSQRIQLSPGNQFFIPAQVGQICFESYSQKPLQMIHCFGPK